MARTAEDTWFDAQSNTRAWAFWRRLASSLSVTWPSKGSDFLESDHYYSRTAILPKVTHVLEVSSLLLSVWEAIVSEFDRRVFPAEFQINLSDINCFRQKLQLQMQDSPCLSDINIFFQKLKISYIYRDTLFEKSDFQNFRMLFHYFQLKKQMICSFF